MSNSSNIFYKVITFIAVCVICVVALFASGAVALPAWLDLSNDQGYDGGGSGGNNSSDVSNVPSALNISLTGDYLNAFNNASKTIPQSDTKSLILIKVGLQVLQSKTIKYENKLHFYSLEYSSSGGTAGAETYSLTNCITRINSGSRIYTDCFGYVRLVHSIACYTINRTSPASVSGISGLYGWKGAYADGGNITSMSNLKSGSVIYDTKTGKDAGYSSNNRHVAIYLYTNNSTIVYMDQSGIKTGQFKSGGYIYSAINSTPYKFNKFKTYC